MNPNPTCELDCRFRIGMTSTTCAHYTPIYDKHGNNTNPDGNITTSEVYCNVCGKGWIGRTQYGKTTYKEVLSGKEKEK